MDTKILIVEDEVLIAEYVKDLLQEDNYQNIKIANDKEEAALHMQDFKPDVILMDINLDGINYGIELAKQKNENAKVIFLTGQYDYDLMSKALETNPESYLTKPIKKQDLIAAIQLAILKKRTDFFNFKSGHEEIKLRFSDILYFNAEGNYVDIYTKTNKYTIRQSLSNILEQLADHTEFVQTQRAFVVNKNHITRKSSSLVYLGSTEIPLSRSYIKSLI